MNGDNYDVILDSIKGKARGVMMSNRNNNNQDIPQMVGLSKLQLFFFILSALLVGAAVFGLGYLFHKNEENISLKNINDLIQGKYIIGQTTHSTSNNKYQQDQLPSQNESFIAKNFYILIGKYKTIEEAQKVQNKLQIKSGKLATLKQTNEGVIIFVGPFESESLARNEKNLLFQKSYIMGSITDVV